MSKKKCTFALQVDSKCGGLLAFATHRSRYWQCYAVMLKRKNETKKGDIKMTMAANCERLTVHVPIAERTRFKRIMRAMGYAVEKKNALDRAMDDVMAGRVYEVSSVDELRKMFA